jgi:hypothetical protein
MDRAAGTNGIAAPVAPQPGFNGGVIDTESQPLDKLRTMPLDKLRTMPLDKLRTMPLDKLRTWSIG